MTVVMRERAKATHVMISYRSLDKTSKKSYYFRSNK